jgi:hypothetical protein
MAASKKTKSSAKSRPAKRTAGKRQPSRAPGKTVAKRSRRATTKNDAAKSPRKRTTRSAAPPATALTSASRVREGDRKPVKKAESRPKRPPAVLPIPQSTFFF